MANSPIVGSEFVFDKAPFPSCHASTIVETNAGLAAAWFGGAHEGAADVAIYFSRQVKGVWSQPSVAAARHHHPCWNPVLFQSRKGPLLLFYKVGPNPSHWWGMMKTSVDAGQTWSDAQRLPEGILGPIKNKPFELSDGTILCPSSEEAQGWRIHFERTSDLGATWSRTPSIIDHSIGAIQPSILPLGRQNLRAVGRTQQGRLFAVDSSDLGQTWGTMHLIDVPNPNSGTDAVRLADGRYLLVYNDTVLGRSPLNVALSKDAEHWKEALDLETDPGEYSYPAVIQGRDGRIHITYTWNRTKIRHVTIDPNLLG